MAVGRRLTVAYGRRVALSDCDFALPAASVTALVGPNGSGKSTLLNAVAGLVPPGRGRLEVLGAPAPAPRRRVAYVFQTAASNELLPVTVREVVTMGRFAELGLFGRLRDHDRRAIQAAMDRLEVSDLADRHLRELSGGQRQRVQVAQGLAQEADVLLLDEPIIGLDLVSRQRILEAVQDERAAGRAVVLSTHDLEDAELADHVLLLAGRVVAQGRPDQVLTARNLREAYGGRLLGANGDRPLIDDDHHHPAAHPAEAGQQP
ncbi:MAG: ATP-binding cassette domain-containing protein [Nitriliruptorales bacterium]|nr:ATP-binding cassette domain-containing protein [Nitriliruptorales bacterium]